MEPAPVPAPLARLAFAALARCYAAFTRQVEGPGVTVGSRGGLVYGGLGTDLPDLNRIMAADADRLPDAGTIEAVLDEMAAYPALSWWIPPGPCQADLETRLSAHGLAVSPSDPEAAGMVMDLVATPALEPLAGVAIDLALSEDALDEAAHVSAAGFGMPDEAGDLVAEICRRMSAHPDGPGRYFVARLAGRPVATSIGVLDGDTVGVYMVATLPEARGRGIGRAITLATLLDGRDRGARIGVLEASTMGHPVYAKLGFRDIGASRVLVRHTS